MRMLLTASHQNSFPSKYQDAYDFMFLMCVFPCGTGFIIEDKIFWVLSSVCVGIPLCLLSLSVCTVWTVCTDTTLCGRGVTQSCTFCFCSEAVCNWLCLVLPIFRVEILSRATEITWAVMLAFVCVLGGKSQMLISPPCSCCCSVM